MKTYKIELNKDEIKNIIMAINYMQDKYIYDRKIFEDLFLLKIKIKEEMEKCIRLD